VHDAKKRLGSNHGAADIKKHSFFEKLNWVLVRNQKPPIVPKLKGPEDTSYFREFKEDLEDSEAELSEEDNASFKAFTPIIRKEKHERPQSAKSST